MTIKAKKNSQLGMNTSTASSRLVKDLLWNFIESAGSNKCYRCGEPMTRDTFSIEHKVPWLDSEDPKGLFFDIDNISYSHLSCNSAARRETRVPSECGTYVKYTTGCRCDPCLDAWLEYKRKNYSKEDRRNRYLKTGH